MSEVPFLLARPRRPKPRLIQLPRLKPGEVPWLLTYATSHKGLEALELQLGSLPAKTRLVTQHLTRRASEELAKRGIEPRFLDHLHAKIIIYPRQDQAVVGSFNITQRALHNNIESALPVPEGYRAGLLRDFDELWESARPFPDDRLQDSAHRYQPPELAEDEAEFLVDRLLPSEWQERLIQQAVDWVISDNDRAHGTVLKLPTGGGKTLVAAELIARLLEKRPGFRVLWLAHRHELLLQAFDRVMAQVDDSVSFFAERGPGTTDYRQGASRQLVFCTQQSIQKLNRQEPAPFDLVVADECHRYHSGAKATYRRFEEAHRKEWGAALLGLTATPTWDRDEFRDYWRRRPLFGDEITKELLVQLGFLAEVDPGSRSWPTGHVFQYHGHGDGRRRLELSSRIREFDTPKVNSEVILAAADFSHLKRVLVFAVSIDHANKLAVRWPGGGAQALHSDLTYAEQRRTIDWFKQPPASDADEPRILINVEMAIEGVDVPAIDGLFLVRPTWSEVYRNQMLGRGLRGPEAGGTKTCTVVDFTYQWLDEEGRQVDNVGDRVFRERELAEGPTLVDLLEGAEDPAGEDIPLMTWCDECRVPVDGTSFRHFVEHVIAVHSARNVAELALDLGYSPSYLSSARNSGSAALSERLRWRIRDWIDLEPCSRCWAPTTKARFRRFMRHLAEDHVVDEALIARYLRLEGSALSSALRGEGRLTAHVQTNLRYLRDRSKVK